MTKTLALIILLASASYATETKVGDNGGYQGGSISGGYAPIAASSTNGFLACRKKQI